MRRWRGMALVAALLLLAGMTPGSARPLLVCRITHAPMPVSAPPVAQGGSCCPGDAPPLSVPTHSLSEMGCCEWQAARDNPRLPTGLVVFSAALTPASSPRLTLTLTPVSRVSPPTVFVQTALRRSAGPRAPPPFS